MKVRLVWITPEAEQIIAFCARVSNPDNQNNTKIANLIQYCIKNKHWSIFEMASACFEIQTSRAISAQLIRHKSFSFQEFSQRYAKVSRYKNHTPTSQTGRQAAEVIADDEHIRKWREIEDRVWEFCYSNYERAIADGYSRETARTILPMNAETTLYMSGSIRSWIHYIEVRDDIHTQKDHRIIASLIKSILSEKLPIISNSIGWSY